MSYRNLLFTNSSIKNIESLLIISSFLITICLFGFVSLLTGPQEGLFNRMPLYVLGTSISFVTAIVFYSLTYKEHQRMHDLLEKHGIEKHEH